MGAHALTLPITSDDTEVIEFLQKALKYFKQGHLFAAYGYVDLVQQYCQKSGIQAADCGRLLLELAYEMAREGLDDTIIEPLLHSANDVMTYDPTGYMEVVVMTGRIHLQKNEPVKALRLYSQVTDLLTGINWAVDKSFIDYFNGCNDRARKAAAEAEIAHFNALFYGE